MVIIMPLKLLIERRRDGRWMMVDGKKNITLKFTSSMLHLPCYITLYSAHKSIPLKYTAKPEGFGFKYGPADMLE